MRSLFYYSRYFKKIFFFRIIILTVLFYTFSCSGTSTIDLLSGNFATGLKDSSPPNALGPADGSTTGLTPVIQWTSKQGATKYILEVSTDPAFSAQITGSPFTINAPDTSYTMNLSNIGGGTYYWRVKADTTNAGQYASGSFLALENSLYVYCASGTVCTNANSDGTRTKPFQTINSAMNRASQLGISEVRIAGRGNNGGYDEVIVAKEGVNITGGYSSDFSSFNKDLYPTIINGLGTNVSLTAENIYSRTVISSLIVKSSDSVGPTYGAFVRLSPGLTIENCVFYVGNSSFSSTTGGAFSYGIYAEYSGLNTSNGLKIAGNKVFPGYAFTDGATVLPALSYGVYLLNTAAVISNNEIDMSEVYGVSNSSPSQIFGIFSINSNYVLNNNVITGGLAKSGGTAIGASANIYNINSSATITNNTLMCGVATSGGASSFYGIAEDITSHSRITNNIIGEDLMGACVQAMVGNPASYENNAEIIAGITTPNGNVIYGGADKDRGNIVPSGSFLNSPFLNPYVDNTQTMKAGTVINQIVLSDFIRAQFAFLGYANIYLEINNDGIVRSVQSGTTGVQGLASITILPPFNSLAENLANMPVKIIYSTSADNPAIKNCYVISTQPCPALATQSQDYHLQQKILSIQNWYNLIYGGKDTSGTNCGMPGPLDLFGIGTPGTGAGAEYCGAVTKDISGNPRTTGWPVGNDPLNNNCADGVCNNNPAGETPAVPSGYTIGAYEY